ncbi:MAG TPA: hypothetical protein VME67_11070 [Mycobacterium sp.]|nr:hypothetical protein [Mycobacterium sp.]
MTTRTGGNAQPSDPKRAESVESAGGGLARLRDLSFGVRTEPLRELRLQVGLDVQIVYVTVHMPVAGGVTLRVPVVTTIAPRFYSPTRAQHL